MSHHSVPLLILHQLSHLVHFIIAWSNSSCFWYLPLASESWFPLFSPVQTTPALNLSIFGGYRTVIWLVYNLCLQNFHQCAHCQGKARHGNLVHVALPLVHPGRGFLQCLQYGWFYFLNFIVWCLVLIPTRILYTVYWSSSNPPSLNWPVFFFFFSFFQPRTSKSFPNYIQTHPSPMCP